MKKFLGVAALLVTMAGAASAQGGGGGGGMANMTPEQRMEMTMTRLFAGITLTDAVKSKVSVLLKTQMDSAATITDRRSPEGMAKNQAFTKTRNDAIKALLGSDADRAKFDSNSAAGGRRGGGR